MNSQFTVSEKAHAELEDSFEHLRSRAEAYALDADRAVQKIDETLTSDSASLAEQRILTSSVRSGLASILNLTRAMNRQTSDRTENTVTTQTTEQSQTTTVTEYGWLKPNGETVWGQVTFGVATIRGYKPETFAGDDVRQADINLLKLMLTEQADRAGVERDYYLQGWSIVARTIITITQPTEHVVVVDEL